jgi:glutamine synthetase
MNDIESWFREHHITEVEALIPDMTGIARGKIVPALKYCREEGMRLPECIFLQTVTGDYPSDERAIHPAEIDIFLRPDLSTLRLVPWAKDPTAQVIHDAYYPDDSPVTISPRYVLQRVRELYQKRGWKPVVAPELEFFLVKPNPDADYPLEPPIGRSGRAEVGRQSFSIDAVNEFEPLFEDIYDYCQTQELEIDTLIHEAGAAQMEFNLRHGDPLDLADQAFLFKRTVREAAHRRHVYATFMAKPMENEPGSSMHIHQSVLDIDSGQNLFSTDSGEPSPLFYACIAGLQKYLPAAMAFFAPNINSYRRIAGRESAPINVHWGYDNRTVGLRIPHAPGQSRRLENRVAGADANPYVAIAASLACGYLGMVEMLEPSEPLEGSAYDLPYGLPRNLDEALQRLSASEQLKDIFGARFVMAYTAAKVCEHETFSRVISSWEREHLLLNV